MKLLIFLVLNLSFCFTAAAQSSGDTLRIYVFDAKSKEPVASVMILYKGYGAIGLTDSTGKAMVEWKYFTDDVSLQFIEACHLSKDIRVKFRTPNVNVFLKSEKCY